MAVPQESGDNYGKVIGQVVDEDTGGPVNEVFFISIFDCSDEANPVFLNNIRSDNNGYFSHKLQPGTYCISFFPETNTSIYCYDPPFSMLEGSKHIISIKAGQISKFLKKAKLAGRLRIILVDKNGEKIDPNAVFNGCDTKNIREKIKFTKLPGEIVHYNTREGDSLDDGEMMMYSLYPESYSLEVYFSDIGIAPVRINEMINISSGKTVEQNIILDLNDSTGIQGVMVDQNSNFIKDARIIISKEDETEYFVNARTNNDGFYKIIGLKEGIYSLRVSIDISATKWKIKKYKNVKISKNMILHKNFVIEFNK